MTLTARYNGQCSKCGGRIEAGEQIEWDKASRKTSHTSCPSKPQKLSSGGAPEHLLASAPPSRTERTNKRADYCQTCGTWTSAGKGRLIYCPEDSGCLEHHDFSGYHVICLDPVECETRRVENRASAKKQAEVQAAKAEAEREAEEQTEATGKAALAAATAELVCTICQPTVALAGGETTIATWKDVRVTRYATERGTIVVQSVTLYDDWRTYYYVPADVADDAVRAWAERASLTRDEAEKWLAEYAGCYGADDYRRFLALVQ